MVSRIRYNKENEMLVSREEFVNEGVKYRVVINVNTGDYKLVSNDNTKILLEGNKATLHEIKKAIKLNLKSLGFNFKNEKRKHLLVAKPVSDKPQENTENESQN